jgi:hypothetical protein
VPQPPGAGVIACRCYSRDDNWVFVGIEEVLGVRLPSARPVRCLAMASTGMTSSAAAAIARPGTACPGRAWLTASGGGPTALAQDV